MKYLTAYLKSFFWFLFVFGAVDLVFGVFSRSATSLASLYMAIGGAVGGPLSVWIKDREKK